jgi:hypothetical protein
MNARTITTLIASAFLLTLLELVAALANTWVALVCALLLAPLAFGIFRFFEVEIANPWIEFLAPCATSLMGSVIVYLGVRSDPPLLLAPLATAAAGGLIMGIRKMGSQRCSLCNRRIAGGVAFTCPRCGLLVCEQHCWSFEHCRCRLCEENRVPVFTPDGRWWDKQFGPRTTYGKCQLCLASAADADLRPCGKCGRPQCRECWDFCNGQCSRCHWMIEDVPEALRPFLMEPPPSPRSLRQ